MLVSGAGTTLRALLAACADPAYGAEVVAVGADRDGIAGLKLAADAGIDTFVRRVGDHSSRDEWDAGLADAVAAYEPDLVVSAGFLKLVGPRFLTRFDGRFINTHPALLPAFPGLHGVRDALAYGVRIAGCTLFVVDAGVDTGPILAQRAVEVRDDDDEETLHERIKVAEREMLTETVGAMVRDGWTVHGRKVKIRPCPASRAHDSRAQSPPGGTARPAE